MTPVVMTMESVPDLVKEEWWPHRRILKRRWSHGRAVG